MNAPHSAPHRKPSQFNAGSGRGELPLWAVLVVATGVLVLGVGQSGGESARTLDADSASLAAAPGAAAPILSPAGLEGAGSAGKELLALPSEIHGLAGDRETLGAGGDSSEGERPWRAESAAPSLLVLDPSPLEALGLGDSLTTGGAKSPQAGPWRRGLREEGSFQHGVRHGLWNEWRSDGTLRSSGQYVSGLREGPWMSFSESGALLSELGFQAGSRGGDWMAYSEDGALIEEGHYSENVPDGRWTTYYTGGQIKQRGLFVSGLREGRWEFYDDLGLPTLESGEYRAGIKIQ